MKRKTLAIIMFVTAILLLGFAGGILIDSLITSGYATAPQQTNTAAHTVTAVVNPGIIKSVTARPGHNRAEWSPKGLLAVVGYGNTVRILRGDDVHGTPLRVFHDVTHLRSIVWSPDGSKLALEGQEQIWVWDVARGILLRTRVGSDPVWSPDSKSLLSVTQIGRGEVWNATTGNVVARSPDYLGPITVNAWSHDGEHVASAIKSSPWVVIWSVRGQGQGPTSIVSFPASGSPSALTWSRNGRYLAITSGNSLQVVTRDGKPVAHYTGNASISAFSWSPRGDYVALGDEQGFCNILSLQLGPGASGTLTPIYEYQGHVGSVVKTISWPASPGGFIVSAATDNTVQFWHVG